jgi:hypothetical protein
MLMLKMVNVNSYYANVVFYTGTVFNDSSTTTYDRLVILTVLYGHRVISLKLQSRSIGYLCSIDTLWPSIRHTTD